MAQLTWNAVYWIVFFCGQSIWANDRYRASHEHFAGKSWDDPAVTVIGLGLIVFALGMLWMMNRGRRKK